MERSQLISLPLQLKEQHKEHSEQRLAIEELERNIRLAEELCPGITERMVKHIIDRWEAFLCTYTLHPFIVCFSFSFTNCLLEIVPFSIPQIYEQARSEVRCTVAACRLEETVSPCGDAPG